MPEARKRKWLLRTSDGKLILVEDRREVDQLIIERQVGVDTRLYEVTGEPSRLGDVAEFARPLSFVARPGTDGGAQSRTKTKEMLPLDRLATQDKEAVDPTPILRRAAAAGISGDGLERIPTKELAPLEERLTSSHVQTVPVYSPSETVAEDLIEVVTVDEVKKTRRKWIAAGCGATLVGFWGVTYFRTQQNQSGRMAAASPAASVFSAPVPAAAPPATDPVPPVPAPPEDRTASARSAQGAPPPAAARAAPRPEDYGRLVAEADRLLERGSTRRAMDLFDAALAAKPNGVEALTGLGYAWLDRGSLARAISFFRRAVKQNQGHGSALFGLAEAHRERGETVQAIEAFEQYLSRLPNGPDAKAAKRQLAELQRPPGL